MANVGEWVKGVVFTVFFAVMYYFLWDFFILGILNFVQADNSYIGTIAWVSYVFLFLMTVPVYLIYSIIIGSGSNVETNPLYLIAAFGSWCVLMPILSIMLTITSTLIGSLNALTIMDAASEGIATKIAWFIYLLVMLILTGVPTYFVLKGYGQIDSGSEAKV